MRTSFENYLEFATSTMSGKGT